MIFRIQTYQFSSCWLFRSKIWLGVPEPLGFFCLLVFGVFFLSHCCKKLIVWRQHFTNVENPCVLVYFSHLKEISLWCFFEQSKSLFLLTACFAFPFALSVGINTSGFKLDVLYFSQVRNMFCYPLRRVSSAFWIRLDCISFPEICQVTGHWNWYFYSKQLSEIWSAEYCSTIVLLSLV